MGMGGRRRRLGKPCAFTLTNHESAKNAGCRRVRNQWCAEPLVKGEKDMQGDCCLVAHANATPPWTCSCSCHDHVDRCLVCDTEIPPGPDFCSASCEERAEAREEQALRVMPLIGPLLDAWEGTDLSFRSDLHDQYRSLHNALQNISRAVEQD
jgi:predicted nucleic acid-binding Zn ribbon protein